MNLQEFRDLSAGHALGALSPDEEQRFQAALTAHPAWRETADADLAVAAELGRSLPEVPPRADVREQILAAIDLVPQAALRPAAGSSDPEPVSATETSRSRRTWLVGALALAASVLVFTTVMIGPRIIESFSPQAPAAVALQEIEEAADAASTTVAAPGGASVTLHWSDAQRRAVLVAEDMAPASVGADYELWIVRGEKAISLGVMKPGDDSRTMFVTDAFTPGDVLAVTVEAEGGSASGVPTSEPILAIATS